MLPKKHWIAASSDSKIVDHLEEVLGIPPLLCQLLVQRGISNFEQARCFFRPEWSHLHDPYLMKDMDKAVDRLKLAIDTGEKILLYGDYDVDGTTSVAMMYHFLQKLHPNLDFYIPDRYKEGYGISYEGLDFAASKEISLIIAMDCGIRAIAPVKAANLQGIDFIICDHHLPEAEIPPAVAVLDPKRPDCAYPYKELSGCGVAFKLAQAYVQKLDLCDDLLLELLDLLVISIASDIVPITGENRILAQLGLTELNKTQRPGLSALIKTSQREPPLSISDIVFGLAPMINAAGRLADADQSVKLMLAKSQKEAEASTKILAYRNKLRREFDQRIAEEAAELFQEMPDWENRRSIVLYQPHWHKGVVGIVASRMVEKFHRPTIILTESGGQMVGSARSVRGYDVHEAIHSCEDLLINFGGHKYAAGLSLTPENLPYFQDRFEGYVYTTLSEELRYPVNQYAAELDFTQITPKFWRILHQFAPFGPGNRNPIFLTRGVKDTGYSKVLKEKHLRLSVQQEDSPVFEGMAFGMGAESDNVFSREPFDLYYTLELHQWKGKRSLQLGVKDLVVK
ncbi:MAG: single-stranded-DNA-specific exonuclease RecJ [Saprospiraceae bacterium]|nr:MAG: single-stranded-DNA-specific exonuclease RecJ [Saprospiraceae bacterium]